MLRNKNWQSAVVNIDALDRRGLTIYVLDLLMLIDVLDVLKIMLQKVVFYCFFLQICLYLFFLYFRLTVVAHKMNVH